MAPSLCVALCQDSSELARALSGLTGQDMTNLWPGQCDHVAESISAVGVNQQKRLGGVGKRPDLEERFAWISVSTSHLYLNDYGQVA